MFPCHRAKLFRANVPHTHTQTQNRIAHKRGALNTFTLPSMQNMICSQHNTCILYMLLRIALRMYADMRTAIFFMSEVCTTWSNIMISENFIIHPNVCTRQVTHPCTHIHCIYTCSCILLQIYSSVPLGLCRAKNRLPDGVRSIGPCSRALEQEIKSMLYVCTHLCTYCTEVPEHARLCNFACYG